MSPDTLKRALIREVPSLTNGKGRSAGRCAGSPTPVAPRLPVVDEQGRLFGVFGEHQLIAAPFPGYLQELRSGRFVPHSIDEVIEQRLECRRDPVSRHATTDQVAADPDRSGAELAETFLEHRVLIVPIHDDDHQRGVVTRSDFFRALAERLTGRE